MAKETERSQKEIQMLQEKARLNEEQISKQQTQTLQQSERLSKLEKNVNDNDNDKPK